MFSSRKQHFLDDQLLVGVGEVGLEEFPGKGQGGSLSRPALFSRPTK